jgi:ATP-dependent RNA helicase DHX37/DHR1
LKKDENLALLRKLSQSKTDVSGLQSSRNLGKSDDRSHVSYEVSSKAKNGTASRKRRPSVPSSEDEQDGFSDDSFLNQPPGAAGQAENLNQSITNASASSGSGLKRPLEIGEDGVPILKARKKRRKITAPEELPWEGFSSEGDAESQVSPIQDDSGSQIEQEESEDSETSTSELSSGPESSEAGNSEDLREKKARTSAFKEWATQQMNEVLDFKPSEIPLAPTTEQAASSRAPAKFEPRAPESDPLPRELQPDASKVLDRKAFSVQVDRSPEIQEARLGLPIVAEEQRIMEAIHNNPVVVVWGATGSGKTTQVPQFLFEAGFGDPNGPALGLIGVTQPRRVAAVSMAKRVSDELGQHKDKVSYQIRFESTASSKTAIKFMTDGVLLREIAQDFALSKYSIIIIDEAHERSVNTDILIGMISRIVDLRNTMSKTDRTARPLKFVIMSATLRIADFMQNPHLFRNGQPPLVQAEGRQYPVTIHFARRTNRDYIEEAFRKVSKGHRKLPQGGILVFLTGKTEIQDLSKRLTQAFATTTSSLSNSRTAHISAVDAPMEAEDIDLGDSQNIVSEDEESDVEFTGVDSTNDDRDFEIGESMASTTPVHVLPLYSQLPTKDQLRIFEPPPSNSRLIVIATNVAETSITIPGIRYVFDCGRSKEKQYDQASGVQSFSIGWISKASASQRAGRAGRTGPGHCYRLYSSAVYERDFAEHTEPEILRTPIEGVVLQMKSLGLDNIINFPFPTSPDRDGLKRAEKLLQNLGAISPKGRVTDLGRSLSIYPLSPRYAKMLQIGNQHSCLPYVIALVASLSVPDIFIPKSQLTSTSQSSDEDILKQYNHAHVLLSKTDPHSDALKLLTATCAYAFTPTDDFANSMFLRHKSMSEILNLRSQLHSIIRINYPNLLGPFNPKLPSPSPTQIKALKQILAAGFIDQVAIRADLSPSPPDMERKPKRSIDVPYLTLLPSISHFTSHPDAIDGAVYIHPSSLLSHTTPKNMPEYLIYLYLQLSSPSSSIASSKPQKMRMFPLTSISGPQLSALAHGTPLLEYGKPIGKVVTLEGKPERRECWVVPSLIGESGKIGWPLPARRVVQRKESGEWAVEKFLT